jgi:hypothetical protein
VEGRLTADAVGEDDGAGEQRGVGAERGEDGGGPGVEAREVGVGELGHDDLGEGGVGEGGEGLAQPRVIVGAGAAGPARDDQESTLHERGECSCMR